jgi:hypothetical protein
MYLPGKNEFELNLGDKLQSGEYILQLGVCNNSGTFYQVKKVIKK